MSSNPIGGVGTPPAPPPGKVGPQPPPPTPAAVIDWQAEASIWLTHATNNQKDAEVYLKALTLACDDMHGDSESLVSSYITMAREAK